MLRYIHAIHAAPSLVFHSLPVHYGSPCSLTISLLCSSILLHLLLCLFIHAANDLVRNLIPQFLVFPLLQYLLPRQGILHQVIHYLQRLYRQRCWLLQHIQRFCPDFQSIPKSIKVSVSEMEQIFSFLTKTRSSDTSSAFLRINCKYFQILGL